MRNIRNRKGGSRKGASTRNRKGGTISSENINRRKERAKSGHNRRIRSHMEGSSRYHGDVPDCVEGGGRVVPGESVREPAVPIEEEPVLASRP
jgi:hypothetical protein